MRARLFYSLPLLVAMLLYGYAIQLPFFLDDGPHFQILAQTNGLQHWGDFPAFPFYRPLTFTIWKFIEGQDASLFHLLNVLLFGLCGVLIGRIVCLFVPTGLTGVLAGCLFVAFPFSYQAVAMVAALFHLTLTLGMLVCIWAALQWLKRGGGLFLASLWIGAFVAVFSHENGVLLPPLLASALLLYSRVKSITWREISWILAPVMTMTAIYFVLWLSFRPNDATEINPDMWVSLAALTQGLVYPFVSVIRPWVEGDAQPFALIVLVIVGIAISTALLWQMEAEIRWLAWYGVGWYVLAVLPAVIVLPAAYGLGQPRLALLASVGGSIFWGVIITHSIRPIGGVLVLLFLYVSIEFLGMRRADFLYLNDFNRQALALFEANDVISTGALLVNAPDYITPQEHNRRFLLGTEGVLFVDETLDYNQQFWMNSTLPYDNVEVVAYDQIQRNEGFDFRAHLPHLGQADIATRSREAAQVYITHFDGRQFYPIEVGKPVESTGKDPLAIFGVDAFALVSAETTYFDDHIIVYLAWQALEPQAVKGFVHVYCEDELIGQSDGYPRGDTYPFSYWKPGEVQSDIRHIWLSEGIEDDCLDVYAGMYAAAEVTRLNAMDGVTGIEYEDGLYPIEG